MRKVCVYAICKNEEKFVKRWYESMKEADKIIVLDTGSSDNTVNLLKECGVDVFVKKIDPWRFDVARNESLKLVPEDYEICVCTDLDEVFLKGWKDKLLSSWKDDTTRARYLYNWSIKKDGSVGTSFYLNKIHRRDAYYWTHPVHEVLTSKVKENEILIPEIVLNHYPDVSKSRSNYLPLLELSVKEDPKDDRNMHYLGREYMYYGKYEDAIRTLKKHKRLKSATWKDERCASDRFIARCYNALGNKKMAVKWYEKAILEAPYLRESYIELAYLEYEMGKYMEAYVLLKRAFEINNKSISYINEEFAWNYFPYDLMSICAFNLKLYNESYENALKAFEKNKEDLRLKVNLELIKKYIQ